MPPSPHRRAEHTPNVTGQDSFIYRFYAESGANCFIYRINRKATGAWGVITANFAQSNRLPAPASHDPQSNSNPKELPE